MVLTGIANLCIGEKTATKLVVNRYGDQLTKLILDAFDSIRPVMLTLANGKVYVGLLDKNLGHDASMAYISILPFLSGYREEKTQKVRFTVNYHSAFEAIAGGDARFKGLDAEALRVIVPTSTVCSARLFDSDLYDSVFNPPERRQAVTRSPNRGKRRPSAE